METNFKLSENLKRTLFVSILFFSFLFVFSAEETIVKSKIENVTVYLNSAQVFKSSSVIVKPGINYLIFDKVSPYLNVKTIQVKGKGSFTILDVKHRIKYPDPLKPSNLEIPQKVLVEISLLEDSIVYVNFDLDDLKKQSEVLNMEKNLLMNNKLVQGNSDTIPEIKEALAYLRVQLLEINKKLLDISKKEYKINLTKKKMNERLADLKNYNSKVKPEVAIKEQPKNQIVVTINSEIETNGKLELSYIVTNAGWSPSYDIRSEGVEKPIQLIQKGNIYQTTGEDWENVKIKLSTLIPTSNSVKPNLNIYYLYYNNNVVQTLAGCSMSKKDKYAPQAAREELSYVDSEKESKYSSDYTTIVQTMTNVEYKIQLPYNIPSDGQNHIVSIANNSLKTDYNYVVVPKLDTEVYLMAKITDFGKFDLLPGTANIYFDGSYIGETSLNPLVSNDTIDLALGKDRSIIVERKLKNSEIKNTLIGSNVIKSFDYEIKIKNSKQVPINIVVEDQIPVSNSKEILVKDIKINGASHNEKTGFIVWKSKLTENSNKVLNFSYSVEYEKNKYLAFL